MRSIVAWSLNFRLLVIPIAAVVLIFGVLQLRETSVDVLPEFAPPYVEIQTEALGLSATEVEQLITVPLERDLLNGVAGIDVIRSESVPGLSSVTLVFEPRTDLLGARQLVQERLTQAHALPNVSKPPTMLQPLSAQSRVLMIGLSSQQLSLTELGVLARWTIRPRVLGVPGVANVVIWGQREHQLQVQVDPQRLRQHGVSLQQIINTTGNAQLVSPLSFLEASTPGTGGFIDTPNQRLQVRHVLPIAKADGLAQVPVEAVDGERAPLVGGRPMRLGDVAEVVEDHQPLIGDAIVGDGPGLLLVVEKFPGESSLEVTRGVEAALDAMRPGLSGVELDSSIFRPANFIESALDNLAVAAIVGSLLLALALVAFFLDWRAVAISLVSIPLSLVTAAVVLSWRGETINALVLAGLVLAIGIVVDDAVAGVEHIWRRLREHRADGGGRSTADVVLEATLEVRAPAVYATLIALLAVLPVFALAGAAGAFFEPVALSYVLAVLASLLVALTVTPALALSLPPTNEGRRRRGAHPFLGGLIQRYGAALSKVLRRPRPALFAAGAAGVVALLLLPQLGRSVVPSFNERELLVHLDGAPGTSRPGMVRIAAQVSRELRGVQGVHNVGAHVGRAVMGDQVVGVNSADVWVSLDSDADYDTTVNRIEEVAGGYPGLEHELLTYSRERIRAVGGVEDGNADSDDRRGDDLAALTGADKPVVVRIYGNELDVLRRKANEVRRLLAGVEGVADPRVEAQVEEPTIEIEPDVAAAGRRGIKPGDIRRAAATLVQGIEVGSLFEEQKVFEVIVVGDPATRHSLTSVLELLIDNPSGDPVALQDVADVRVATTPTVIEREAASRRIDVTADVSGRDLGSVLDDVEVALDEVSFPLEYHAEVLSESTERAAANRRTLAFAVAAAIGIFLLLQAAFGSWLLALLFFAALPIALLGGVLVAFVDGRTLSLGAVAGLLTVFGIAVRHGVVLIDRFRRLEGEQREADRAGAVLRGAKERLAPILTTAAAAALALTPVLVLGEVPGHEILHPLAVVVVGGLVTSTLFALFVVPALYLLVGPSARQGEPT